MAVIDGSDGFVFEGIKPSQFGELMDENYSKLHPDDPVKAILAIERCVELLKTSSGIGQDVEEAALEIAVCARALWEGDF